MNRTMILPAKRAENRRRGNAISARSEGDLIRANGERVNRQEIAERLREMRGRLPRRLMCKALGWDPNNKHDYQILNKLIRDYELSSADAIREAPDVAAGTEKLSTKARAAQIALAKEQLKKEIALAVKERATAPPYRGGGDLDW